MDQISLFFNLIRSMIEIAPSPFKSAALRASPESFEEPTICFITVRRSLVLRQEKDSEQALETEKDLEKDLVMEKVKDLVTG